MCGDNLSGKKKYNNGTIAKYFIPGQQPDGWVLGSTELKKRKNSEAQKKLWSTLEYRDQVDEYYHGEKFKEKRSEIAKKSWKKNYENHCESLKKSNKERWTEEEKKKQSQRMVEKWADFRYRESQTKSLRGVDREKIYEDNPEIKDRISKSVSANWETNKEEILQKLFNSKSKNKSWNTSKLEEGYYSELVAIYGNEDVIRQYRDERYPFYCDFYIKSLDKFIELNGTWCHGLHPFDENNEEDLDKLKQWLEKAISSNYYKNAIKVWTIVDPIKVKTAKENNLNIEFIY